MYGRNLQASTQKSDVRWILCVPSVRSTLKTITRREQRSHLAQISRGLWVKFVAASPKSMYGRDLQACTHKPDVRCMFHVPCTTLKWNAASTNVDSVPGLGIKERASLPALVASQTCVWTRWRRSYASGGRVLRAAVLAQYVVSWLAYLVRQSDRVEPELGVKLLFEGSCAV